MEMGGGDIKCRKSCIKSPWRHSPQVQGPALKVWPPPSVCVSAVRTMYLRPRDVNVSSALASNIVEIPFEADSHADTTCLGGGALKILDYNTPVRVQGYDPALGAREYQTISGGLVYTHPHTQVRYHLIFHQAIHMPHLDHHLLCPMQLRAHGVTVNECPRIY